MILGLRYLVSLGKNEIDMVEQHDAKKYINDNVHASGNYIQTESPRDSVDWNFTTRLSNALREVMEQLGFCDFAKLQKEILAQQLISKTGYTTRFIES